MQPANPKLEKRVANLERQLRALQSQLKSGRKATARPWWERLAGKFKDDPLFDETIKAGKAYRHSLAGRKR